VVWVAIQLVLMRAVPCGTAACHGRRRQTGGEHQRARVVLQGLNDIGSARGISANRCQRFTEGAGKRIDLVLQLEMPAVAAKAHERQKVRAGTAREAALGHKLERYIERFGHINVQWQADTLKA